MTTDINETLTVTKVAASLGVCRRTLYNMIEDGRFPVKPVKGTDPRRWLKSAVDDWKAAQ